MRLSVLLALMGAVFWFVSTLFPPLYWEIVAIITIIIFALLSKFFLISVKENTTVIVYDYLFKTHTRIKGPDTKLIFPWETGSESGAADNTFITEFQKVDCKDAVPTADELRLIYSGTVTWVIDENNTDAYNKLDPKSAKSFIDERWQEIFNSYAAETSCEGDRLLDSLAILAKRPQIKRGLAAYIESRKHLVEVFGVKLVSTLLDQIDYDEASNSLRSERARARLQTDADSAFLEQMHQQVEKYLPNGSPEDKEKLLETMLVGSKSAGDISKRINELRIEGLSPEAANALAGALRSPAVAGALGTLGQGGQKGGKQK